MKVENQGRKKAGKLILRGAVFVLFLLLAAQFLATPVAAFTPSASPRVLVRTLTGPNPTPSGLFGFAVAATNNLVFVGDVPFSGNGYLAGHVDVFSASTGRLIRTLASPSGQSDAAFGGSVAASGNILVVGAVFETVNGQKEAGHVYVFNAETGALRSTLTSPNAQSRGAFGSSVAVSGNIVVVGALGEGEGHAYTFEATTGDLIHTFTSPNPQSNGLFGSSVALSGNIMVVGAPFEAASGKSGAGRAYVFDLESGSLLSTLESPRAQSVEYFGWSVAERGDLSVVGAPGEGLGSPNIAGHAYVFNAETGALLNTIESPDAQLGGGFGYSVSATGSILVVGAPYETGDGQNASGHVYTFNLRTGALKGALTSPNAQSDGGFGGAVAESSNILVTGAPGETVNGQHYAGHAYVFQMSKVD